MRQPSYFVETCGAKLIPALHVLVEGSQRKLINPLVE